MNLKEFRIKNNLKQKDMQKIFEMNSISQYQNLEKDLINGGILSIKNALKLSQHFQISLDEIYGIAKQEKNAGISATSTEIITPLEDDLLEVFRTIGENLGEPAQRAFIAIGESIAKNSQ